MSNHFCFIDLIPDTNYLDAIQKVCYTISLLVLKYFLLLTHIYDFFINYKVQQLYLFYLTSFFIHRSILSMLH